MEIVTKFVKVFSNFVGLEVDFSITSVSYGDSEANVFFLLCNSSCSLVLITCTDDCKNTPAKTQINTRITISSGIKINTK